MSAKGVRGICPLQANFLKFPLGGTWGNESLWTSIGSACYSWQITRRKFACCASLGEHFTTHKDIFAPVVVNLTDIRLFGAALANKKLPQPEQGRVALFWLIAV